MSKTNKLNQLIEKFLKEQTNSQPDVLWHYTNTAGFLGICRTGKLWATNTEYLNDISELRYARSLLLNATYNRETSSIDKNEINMLNSFRARIRRDLMRPVFVTSLSAVKNELSQWRAYGGSSGSFALGFNTASLVAAVEKNNTAPQFKLYKCIYDEQRSRCLCQRFVDELCDQYRVQQQTRNWDRNDRDQMPDLVERAVELFDKLAPLIKHPDFVQESEWRLVSELVDLETRPIRLREGRTGIVPYIELIIAKEKTDPGFLVHTMIGPSIRYDPRNSNLAQMIAYCDDFILKPFPLEPTRTPYRPE